MNKGSLYFDILLLLGSILFGEGLHRVVTPPFWANDAGNYRAVTLFPLALGSLLMFLAYSWHKKAKRNQQEATA